jgi:hypothetical protein
MNSLEMAKAFDEARRELRAQSAWYEETHDSLNIDPESSGYRDLWNALEFEAALLATLLGEAFNREMPEKDLRAHGESHGQDAYQEERGEVSMTQSE